MVWMSFPWPCTAHHEILQRAGGWQPQTVCAGPGERKQPLVVQAFPLRGAQPAGEALKPWSGLGLSGYRRTAGVPLLQLKAGGLNWAAPREGMLLQRFEQQGGADVSPAQENLWWEMLKQVTIHNCYTVH